MTDVTPPRKQGYSNDTNLVILTGGLVRVNECFKNDHFSVRRITLVTNGNKRNPDGTYTQVPTYHTVRIYGKLAEVFQGTPGEKYVLHGHLKTFDTTVEGKKQYKTEIVCDKIFRVGGVKKDVVSTHEERQAELPNYNPADESVRTSRVEVVDDITIEDVPF